MSIRENEPEPRRSMPRPRPLLKPPVFELGQETSTHPLLTLANIATHTFLQSNCCIFTQLVFCCAFTIMCLLLFVAHSYASSPLVTSACNAPSVTLSVTVYFYPKVCLVPFVCLLGLFLTPPPRHHHRHHHLIIVAIVVAIIIIIIIIVLTWVHARRVYLPWLLLALS
eukprot:686899-Hanusia_phi.AAC.6